MVVKVDTRQITSWESLHKVFAATFGFPDFPEWYGRNMNAWIDCMSSLDYPDDGLSEIKCQVGGVVVLQLDYANTFCVRAPVIFQELLDCSASGNWGRIERGYQAILALSYHK